MNKIVATTLLTCCCLAASASNSPYQGEEARDIKSLGAAEIADLLAGNGMGQARAAELNHYPGPRHVLDLADELGLSPGQRAQTEAIHARMQAEARRLGKLLVDGEQALDRQFRSARVTAESLSRQLAELGELRARLRGVHLLAHIEQRELLTLHQLHRYDQLRGYARGHDGHDGHGTHTQPPSNGD